MNAMKTMSPLEARAATTTADPRWQSIVGRDRRADSHFVYAVRTTGIYCRPSCPARTARPENVTFHASAAEAERLGFRACRRCRPNEASSPTAHAVVVASLCRFIEDADEAPPLAELARRVGMSRWHVARLFKSVTGVTPRAYADACRARRMREALAQGAAVTDALYTAGYNAQSRFYAQSDAVLGMTASRYRRGGADAEIRFAVGQCSLGAILVARSDRGICAISLGDDADALVRELQDRFPNATLIGGDAEFERWVAKVVGLVEAPRIGLDLPLDVRGTAFQQRVWQALRDVPAGETLSYRELAQRIGAPNAVRAVAGACAANTLAVAIPCHRVVRNDGDLSGYRWGVARKRALLDREAEARSTDAASAR
jgi:AraC family transcriptional regulator of adaptative response/methylated-DNA-[protein]-cysteine methyltransferase